ncbi:MAG: hypothetical protein OXU62_07865 [Gammaproteobacteria bacterium]|nr:hypothetical protein [Gammaproteobacteria bacterium]
MNTHTENTAPKQPESAPLSDEQLGKVNAAGRRVNPVNPALHPDDPADGTAIQKFRLRPGGGSI